MRALDATAQRLAGRWLTPPPTTLPHPQVAAQVKIIKLHGLGNLCMVLPWAAALRRACPAWQIEVLTLEENLALWDVFTPPVAVRGLSLSPWSMASVAARWRLSPVDLVIDAEPYAQAPGVLARLVGARGYIGLRQPGSPAWSVPWPSPQEDTDPPKKKTTLKLRSVGEDHMMRQLGGLFAQAAQRPLLPAALRPNDPTAGVWPDGKGAKVLLQPGTGPNAPQRRWPTPHFAWLAAHLIHEDKARVVVACAPHERALGQAVVQAMPTSLRRRVSLLVQDGLHPFVAQVASADILVSNDSFPIHLASLLGTPAVGLYGPNTPVRYGPWGAGGVGLSTEVPCSPCLNFENRHETRCADNVCMQLLSPGRVLSAVRQVVAQVG